jgi:uncharacterized membrane protein (UPF0136 family)
MYALGFIGLLVVAGGLIGLFRAKRTAATESSGSYRRSGFTGQ